MQARRQVWLTGLVLAVLTFGVYAPVVHYDFLNYDDPEYVTENPHIKAGVTWDGIKWAFQNPVASHWHPLTLLSHMLDSSIYGMEPGGHHLTNVWFHAVNTILLFVVLVKMTNARWRSAFVAALFALHPMHVESVAWISERKDVLSTFFFLLCLWAYTSYAQENCANNLEKTNFLRFNNKRAKVSYFLAILFFAFGLMSKPMLVTLPFLLLLLDFWPLSRFSIVPFSLKQSRHIFFEKIPFFALTLASCAITFVFHEKTGGVWSAETSPVSARLTNALVAYAKYVEKLFWPRDLAILYPIRSWDWWQGLLAGGFVLLTTIFVVRGVRRRPYIAIGWFWFVGTLVPVIGIVQVGFQFMADRYTYIPAIGLFIAVTWTVYEYLKPVGTRILLLLGALSVIVCAILTSVQLRHWQNSVTLFQRTIAVTEQNYIAQNNLGQALGASGRLKEATPHFIEAIRLNPNYPQAHNNLALNLASEDEFEDALVHFEKAIRLKPDYAEAFYNLGDMLAEEGDNERAIHAFLEAIRHKPDFGIAHLSLGIGLAKANRTSDAIAQYRAALRSFPDDAKTHYNLANALFKIGETGEAIAHYKAALASNPFDAQTHNNLASALQRSGDIQKAAEHFQQALQLRADFPEAHFNLAMLLGRQGDFSGAITHLKEVIRLQPDNDQAHSQMGEFLVGQKDLKAAIRHFRESLRLNADSPPTLNFLARILATSRDSELRDGKEAVQLAERACKLVEFKNFAYLDTLGAALAEQGNFLKAMQVARQAKELAENAGQNAVADQIQMHITKYENSEPLREF